MAFSKFHNSKLKSIHEMRGQLLELIFGISEAETEELLQELSLRYNSKNRQKEKRKHPRKGTFIPIDFSGNKCTFTDFIQNISESGIYIETQMPFFINQKLLMSFSHPANNNPIKITGTIARIDSHGIGIQFDGLIPCI